MAKRKSTNNDLQNTTQKTKDRATWTTLKISANVWRSKKGDTLGLKLLFNKNNYVVFTENWSRHIHIFVLTFPFPTELSWVSFFYNSLNSSKLCDKICQWLATGRWFFPGTPVSSSNKTDRHDITEILLKVALNTIHQPKPINYFKL